MPPYRAPIEGGTALSDYALTDPALADPNYIPPPPGYVPYDPAQDTQGMQAQPPQIALATPEAAAQNPDASYAYGTGQPYYETGYTPPESTQQTIYSAPAPEAAATLPADQGSSYNMVTAADAVSPAPTPQPSSPAPGPGSSYNMVTAAQAISPYAPTPPVQGAKILPQDDIDRVQSPTPASTGPKKGPNSGAGGGLGNIVRPTPEETLASREAYQTRHEAGVPEGPPVSPGDLFQRFDRDSQAFLKEHPFVPEMIAGMAGPGPISFGVRPIGGEAIIPDLLLPKRGSVNATRGGGSEPLIPEVIDPGGVPRRIVPKAPSPEAAIDVPFQVMPERPQSMAGAPERPLPSPDELLPLVDYGPTLDELLPYTKYGPRKSELVKPVDYGPSPDELIPRVDYGPALDELLPYTKYGPRKSELVKPVDYGPSPDELIPRVDYGPQPLQGPLPSELGPPLGPVLGPTQPPPRPTPLVSGKPSLGTTNATINNVGRPSMGGAGAGLPPGRATPSRPPLPTASQAAAGATRSFPTRAAVMAALGLAGVGGAKVALDKTSGSSKTAPASAPAKATPAASAAPTSPTRTPITMDTNYWRDDVTTGDKASKLGTLSKQLLTDGLIKGDGSFTNPNDPLLSDGKWSQAAADKQVISADMVGKPAHWTDMLIAKQGGNELDAPAQEATDADVAGDQPVQQASGSGGEDSGESAGSSKGYYDENGNWVWYNDFSKKRSSGGGSSRSYGGGGGGGSSGGWSHRSAGGGGSAGSHGSSDFGNIGGSFDWHDFLEDTDHDGKYSPSETRAAKKKAKLSRKKKGGTLDARSMNSRTQSSVRSSGLIPSFAQAKNPQIRADILAALEESTGRPMPANTR